MVAACGLAHCMAVYGGLRWRLWGLLCMTVAGRLQLVIVLHTLCVICKSLYCALFEVLADSVFYWKSIFNRNNITFQMTSNDVNFFSLQFISLKLPRVTSYITGSSFVLPMQAAHFTG